MFLKDRISIREGREEDIPEVLEIYRTAGIESDDPFTPQEGRRHFTVFSHYPSYRLFVVLMEGAIVGTYELLIMDNLAKRGRRSGVVEDVAVSPHYQGCGIGRAMMLHAIRQCKDAQCYKLTLSSGLKRTNAHDFYETIGFEQHGLSFHVPID